LVACLLTLPVAGTALYIADPYVTPRSIVLFAVLFAALNAWNGRYARFTGWSVFAAMIHPLMAALRVFFPGLLLGTRRLTGKNQSGGCGNRSAGCGNGCAAILACCVDRLSGSGPYSFLLLYPAMAMVRMGRYFRTATTPVLVQPNREEK